MRWASIASLRWRSLGQAEAGLAEELLGSGSAHRLARPRFEGHAPLQGRGHGALRTDPWPQSGLFTRRTNEPLDRPVGKPSREQQLVERRFDIGLKR